MGFDGLPDTKCKCQQNNAIITIAFSPAITVNKSLKLRYAGSGYGSGYIQIEANGTEVVDTPASGKDGTIIDIPFTGSLTSISIQEGSQNAGFSQIFVDGDVLMNGPWNTSKNWAASSGLNTSNRGPITLAFNGSIGDSVSEGINNSDTVVIGTNITINTSLQYWSYNSSGVSTTWRFKRASDGNIAVTTLDSADKNDYDYTTVPLPTESGHGLGVEYSQISAQRSTSYETISAIRLDGQVLVDPTTISVTEVTGPTFPPATGTISAVDSTNSKITFSETTGRWLVTQSDYDTAKKLDTTVRVPLVLDASNSAHVALFNALNTKFTAFPTVRQTFIDALRTKIIGLTLTTPELEVLCGTAKTLVKRHEITIVGNKFYIDGVLQATLSLKKGTTYIFDQDESTNSGHTLKLYTDANKTTEYTSGVTVIGTPGGATSRTTFVVPSNAPAVLYYQSTAAASMGGQLNISQPTK